MRHRGGPFVDWCAERRRLERPGRQSETGRGVLREADRAHDWELTPCGFQPPTLAAMRRPTHSTIVWLTDALLAVSFFAVAVLELTRPVEEMHQRAALPIDVALQALFCSALVLRSHHPRASAITMTAAFIFPSVVAAHAVLFFGNFVPFLLVIYAVTRNAPDLWSRSAWLIGVVFWIGLVLRSGPYFDQVRNPLLPVVISVVVWGGARVVRRLAEQRHQLDDALALLAAEQAMGERRAVARERARVAADMHDVVAHAVSLMVVQIGHARTALERSGESRPRLRTAEETGRQALIELRRSLGVLRRESDEAGDQAGDEVVSC